MNWKHAAGYWLCFAALGGFYIADVNRTAPPPPAEMGREEFLQVAEGDITGLELRHGAAEVRARRVDGRWELLEPAGRSVPQDLLAAFVGNFINLPSVEVVDDGSKGVAAFGLAPPSSEIRLTRRDGSVIKIRVGARNPAGIAIYAQRDDNPHVFLLGLNVRYYEELLLDAVRG